MKLYFLRHGKADWPDWEKPDDERPLTKKGKKETRRMAKFLRDFEVKPALILTSPLPRAAQTAKITAKCLDVKLKEEAALSPGFGMKKLGAILKRAKDGDPMIVGHEPDFSVVIAALTGGEVDLAKGGAACVELESASSGRLVWLIPPRVAKV
ncbi:MAG: phosphohistidine phosphatase SixA [Chthoniobacterales bacterium]